MHGFGQYALCVYDGSANTQPLMETPVTSGNCGAKGCWRASGSSGFVFRDPTAALGKVKLKAGIAGKAALSASGKGAGVAPPALPLTLPVTADFVIYDGSALTCFETAFATETRNDAQSFRATGP